jgi:hypothetical protein
MKKSFLPLLVFAFASILSLTRCNKSIAPTEIEESHAINVSYVYDSADVVHKNDIYRYRQMVKKIILTNNKALIQANLQASRTMDWKRMSDLGKMNLNLEKKIDEYNREGKNEWESFKIDLNSDLIELDKAFADL